MRWSKSIARSLCFPIMPLYSRLVKILLLCSICPISDVVCAFCPNWLVYAASLSNKWRWYELIICLCLTLWLACAHNREFASNTVSRLTLELIRTSLLRCNFPCNSVSVRTGRKRQSYNKWNKTWAGTNSCGRIASQQTEVSLLAC